MKERAERRRRAHISLKTKLAAALCTLMRVTEDGKLERIIPHERAKEMSEDQVLALFQWDHDPIPHCAPYFGPDVHWNLTPRLHPEARAKTAKVDIPAIAKGRRVSAEHEEFQRRILAKGSGTKRQPKQKSKIPSRPFPKGKRSMRSR